MTEKTLSARQVLSRLNKLYEPPKTFLQWKTPLDLLVATLLSAQCTDAQVNKTTKKLFKKYRKPADYNAVSRKELERDVYSCGTYRRKAKHIQDLSAILIKKHKGKVPDRMEDLVRLPGIGRKTAAIVLNVVFGKQEGIAVDTHVIRLAQRLGLTKSKNQNRIELDLMNALPRTQWGKLTTLLISHGRAVCTARKRQCDKCVFSKECPSSTMEGRTDLSAK